MNKPLMAHVASRRKALEQLQARYAKLLTRRDEAIQRVTEKFDSELRAMESTLAAEATELGELAKRMSG